MALAIDLSGYSVVRHVSTKSLKWCVKSYWIACGIADSIILVLELDYSMRQTLLAQEIETHI